MDVLLTHAYYLYEDPAERRVMKPYPPLGLLYVAAYLRSQNFDVEVLDSTFMSREEHLASVRAARAPVVGVYVNLMTRANALKVINAAKETGSRVVLGGPEPVNHSEEYLQRGVDAVVAGEGEHTLAELIPLLQEPGPHSLDKVAGVICRDSRGDICRSPPRAQIRLLDDLPFPARDMLDMSQYMDTWRKHHGAGSVSLITARGCPYTCRWCSHSVYGFTYRHRSPENVASEVEHIRDTYNPDQVWYADDVFTMSRHWLRAYCEELERRGLFFPFETISREDRLDEEMVELLARLGCYRLWVGAESGSQRVLDAMDRRTDARRMREVIGMLKDYGIRTGTFIMLGYENETWDDIDRTAEHLRQSLPDDVLTTLAYPIKGTSYYDDVESRLVINGDWESISDRDIFVSGRYSRRFYRHAQQWLGSEIQLAQEKNSKGLNLIRRAKALLKARQHRAAMYLYRHEVERC